MSAVTKYIATFEGKLPTDFTNVYWRPWVNCDPKDELLPQIALHRHLRDRGGILPGETLQVFVCIVRQFDPITEVPVEVDYTHFIATKDETET